MKILPLSAITILPRQRQKIVEEPLHKLITDISENGLHHPIVVEQIGDGSAEYAACPYILLAGERRLRAIQSFETAYLHGTTTIEPGFIPCTIYENVTEEQRILIELNENLLRENITWQEEALAIAQLHKLRNQSARATARELETYRNDGKGLTTRVQQALIVSDHLNEPTVKNARSLHEASQAVLRTMEADVASRLAEQTHLQSPHTFISGDFAAPSTHDELLANSFDVILADPPYGMDADNFGSTTTKHAYNDSTIDVAKAIINFGFRLAKPQAFLFLFCDIDRFWELRDWASQIGWKPWRTPLIWDKTSPGIEPIPHQGFARQYELILYAVKGNKLRTQGTSDVISIPRISSPGHSAAKPPDLYSHLLSRSGNAGDTVLDPCCGVGTVFHAARQRGWIATGVELDRSLAKRCEAAARGALSDEGEEK